MTDQATVGSNKPTQLSITYLLLLTWAVCIAMAPLGRWGVLALPASVLLLVISMLLIHRRYAMAAICLLPFPLFGFLYLAVTDIHPGAEDNQCVNNLKQIALAIANYESANGHLPPPYSTDETNRPLHSWRVLILPYLEEKKLYDQIDLSQPWDAPANHKFANRMPSVFRCPRDDSPFATVTTPYVAVIGSETAWPTNGKRVYREIKDGLSKTLLVVESVSKKAHWMNPMDPTFTEIVPIEANGRTLILASNHSSGCHGTPAAFCDCHVEYLSEKLSWQFLRALFTIDGGEKGSTGKLSNGPEVDEVADWVLGNSHIVHDLRLRATTRSPPQEERPHGCVQAAAGHRKAILAFEDGLPPLRWRQRNRHFH